MARDSTTDNYLVSNKGLNPVVNFNFMVRVEGLFDLPCKSVKAFSREMEYEYIQEGGVNDYVHMRRKPISRPFTLEIERYTGVDYIDPMPNGLEMVLPLIVFVSRYQDYFIPGVVFRTYIFTGCTVIKKTYGELDAERSGLLTETTTIAYREMLCVDLPWSEVGAQFAADQQKSPPTSALTAEKDREAALDELEMVRKQAEELQEKAEKLRDDADAFARAQPAPGEGEDAPDYAALNAVVKAEVEGEGEVQELVSKIPLLKKYEEEVERVMAELGMLEGVLPYVEECLEVCTEGESRTGAKEIREAVAQAKELLQKARQEYTLAEKAWGIMKSAGQSDETEDFDAGYWEEIADRQARLKEDADNRAGEFDEEYWKKPEAGLETTTPEEEPEEETGEEAGEEAEEEPEEEKENYWAEIAEKQAELDKDADNRIGEFDSDYWAKPEEEMKEEEEEEKEEPAEETEEGSGFDPDYWTEIAEKQAKLKEDADNRAGGEVDGAYWDEVSEKQDELEKDADNRAGGEVDGAYWDEVSEKQDELEKDADNRAGGEVDEDYWDEISEKQAEQVNENTGETMEETGQEET